MLFLYFIDSYLYVSCSGSITSVGEEGERAISFRLLLLTCKLCVFCSESFPLPLDAWDLLRYFIVTLHEPPI